MVEFRRLGSHQLSFEANARGGTEKWGTSLSQNQMDVQTVRRPASYAPLRANWGSQQCTQWAENVRRQMWPRNSFLANAGSRISALMLAPCSPHEEASRRRHGTSRKSMAGWATPVRCMGASHPQVRVKLCVSVTPLSDLERLGERN